MRIVGLLNAFDELADPDLRLGRKVANHGLTAALLEYSSADELHFFLPFQSAAGPFEKGYARWLDAPENQKRVRLLPAARLPEAAARFSYQAVHAAELDRYFPELCHLRNRAGGEPFPVTCTTHTLNYWSTRVRNLYKVLPGPRPYDAVFCTSRAAREHLAASFESSAARLAELGLKQAGYAGRLETVPLGVRAADFVARDRAQAQRSLGLAPGPVTLLYIGRLTPMDKCDLTPLLGALFLLARRHDARLVLAGAQTAGYGAQLMEAAAQFGVRGRVHLFPDFDSSQKADLLAAADIFVSPSDNLQETFGLSILEAMAAGLPVAASDFSGYRDLVVHGETGFLVPTLGPADYSFMDAFWPLAAERVAALQVAQRTAVDMDVLLESLETLIADPELRRRMGQAGRRRVLERFDWPVVVRAMETLWAELKAEALARGAEPPAGDVLDASLGRLFGHFPTRSLGPDDQVAPGPLAAEFAAGRWARRPHPDLAGLLPPEALELLLETVQKIEGGASLARLQETLAAKMPPHLVEHLVLYGLKQGVLSRPRGRSA